MPIIWRYLIIQYLKVLGLATTAFVAVLLTTRLDELAHFITLAPNPWLVIEFVLHQVPYILPIALPISALISTALLFQGLSQSHELTALRASGMALRGILSPILLTATLLAILNFYITSELATHSHLRMSTIKNELRSVNPLLVLHNKHLLRVKGMFFDTLGPSKLGESASDVILAMPNKKSQRIHLLLAKELKAAPESFSGYGVTIFTNLGEENEAIPERLVIENIGSTTFSIDDFANMFQKKTASLNYDHLRFPLLRVKMSQLEEDKKLATHSDKIAHTKELRKIYSEAIRRFSLATSVFTFTLLGAAYGISLSRHSSRRGVIWIVVLGALCLVTYFAAKAVDHHLWLSASLYLVPQALIIALSFFTLRRLAHGID